MGQADRKPALLREDDPAALEELRRVQTAISANCRAEAAQENVRAWARQRSGSIARAARAAAPRSSCREPTPEAPITSTGTGTPAASDSSSTSPKVSVIEGKTNTSAAA